MSIKAECKFHGVGHGLFYSGLIKVNKKENEETVFSFVYDCGAWPSIRCLNSEIDKYKRHLANNDSQKPRINMLVISHFHRDHINGLNKLLENSEIDMVIIPYVTPEQCNLYVSSLADDADGADIDQFLLDFYDNPVNWLSQHKVQIIIQMLNNSDDYKDDYGNKLKKDFKKAINRLRLDTKTPIIVDSYVRDTDSGKTEVYITNDFNELELRKELWKFKFKNFPIQNEVNSEFYDGLMREFSSDGQKIDTQKLIEDGHFLQRLRVYNRSRNSAWLNQTSILMYHAPAKIEKSTLLINQDDKKVVGSTMLTGDIGLTEENDEMIFDFNTISIVLIPHHGSKTDNDIQVWTKYNSLCYVISHSCPKKHGLPNKEVLDHLRQCDGETICVIQNKSFFYKIVVDEQVEDGTIVEEILYNGNKTIFRI